MESIKTSNLYNHILKEINYPFGDVFIFDGYVVSEIKNGVVFTWENHAKQMAQDVADYFGTDGNDIIYISNRINTYSIMATDWLKFFKNSYSLKGYYVVGSNINATINLIFENLFFTSKIKRFEKIEAAVLEAKEASCDLISA